LFLPIILSLITGSWSGAQDNRRSRGNNVQVHTVYATPVQLSDKAKIIDRNDGTLDPLLYDLLSKATPSTTEGKKGHESRIYQFIKDAVAPREVREDKVGNLVVYIPKVKFEEGVEKKYSPSTLFSCHMDTVHYAPDDLILMVTTDKTNGNDPAGMVYAATAWHNVATNETIIRPATLGADDKVGVWIMCKFIQRGIPGLYVFHVGEENGSIGSRTFVKNFSAEKTVAGLKGLKRAVAFDRAGYTDVICHQRGTRCCSKEFGNALAKALNEVIGTPAQQFKSDIHGSFTDTANYTGVIGECTNISSGYFSQHGSTEHFDAVWVQQIYYPALAKMDWDALPTVRKPGEKEVYSYVSTHTTGRNGSLWTYTGKTVLPTEIVANTPYIQIPLFKFDTKETPRWPAGATKYQVSEMIKKAISDNRNTTQLASQIADYLHNMFTIMDFYEDLQQPLTTAPEDDKSTKLHTPAQIMAEKMEKTRANVFDSFAMDTLTKGDNLALSMTTIKEEQNPVIDRRIKQSVEAFAVLSEAVVALDEVLEKDVEKLNVALADMLAVAWSIKSEDADLENERQVVCDYLISNKSEVSFAFMDPFLNRDTEQPALAVVS